MLDPLTALGLLGNILQLLTFLADVTSQARKAVQTAGDILPSHQDISRLSERRQLSYNHINTVVNGVQPLNKAEALVASTAQACASDTEKLLDLLKGLAPRSSPKGRVSLPSALWKVTQARSKIRDVERYQKKLESYERQLALSLLSLIRSVTAALKSINCFHAED